MATARDDQSSYLRGKAHLAGLRPDTPLNTACDLLLMVEVDGVPQEQLKKWRGNLDRALWKIRPPDRDTWGLLPEQQAAMARLAGRG